jgi:endonuclease G, mitochondrial
VPQTHASNAGPWLDLEDESRQLANQGKQLLIIAGPIFAANPPTIGTGVQVPASMFKVAAVLEGGVITKVYAAIIPNASVLTGSWRQWQVTERTVEQQTGLNFLSDLPREEQDVLENRVDP